MNKVCSRSYSYHQEKPIIFTVANIVWAVTLTLSYISLIVNMIVQQDKDWSATLRPPAELNVIISALKQSWLGETQTPLDLWRCAVRFGSMDWSWLSAHLTEAYQDEDLGNLETKSKSTPDLFTCSLKTTFFHCLMVQCWFLNAFSGAELDIRRTMITVFHQTSSTAQTGINSECLGHKTNSQCEWEPA